ncbi:MAG: DUF4386 domain-containing protein [Saprospiraceae bacterium]
MKSQKVIARTFGIFFIFTFLSYGIGSELANTAIGSNAINNTLIVGVILMAIFHTIFNVGLLVLMQPILKPINEILSTGYLSAGIAATVTLLIGNIFLLLHIPLSETLNVANGNPEQYEMLSKLLFNGNFYAYQLGMTIWGIGGLMFCYLLYVSKLVPKVFPIWGIIGYLIFIAGTIAELFGYKIGVQLSLPGGLFELALSGWLIVKGFRPTVAATA